MMRTHVVLILCGLWLHGSGPGADSGVEAQQTNEEYIHMNTFPDDLEEDYGSLVSLTGDEERPKKVDPEGSWFAFVRHSSKGSGSSTSSSPSSSSSSKKKCEEKKKRKRNRDSRILPVAEGPVGPQGPMGPPGPPGALITKQELLNEFRVLIREAAERRAHIIIGEKCPSCLVNITQGEPTLPALEELDLLPTLPIAFHCKLSRDLNIPGKSLIEVDNFRTPIDTGSFRRGQGLDVSSGRFTAPRTAIYQLAANLHVGQRLTDVKEREPKPRDNVRLLICINSMCQRHTSLEFVSGMESNSRVFTVAVSGLLKLEEGQYASVYVDNSSGRRIEIQVGSDFSGVLMGV